MNGFKADYKVMVDKLTDECFQAIKTTYDNYLSNLISILISYLFQLTRNKFFIILLYLKSLGNKNKCKISRIPPSCCR